MILEKNRQSVLAQIHQAEIAAQRMPNSVQLIAVSKTFPAENIRVLYQHGQRDFGENYVQEFAKKCQQLSDCPDIVWHLMLHKPMLAIINYINNLVKCMIYLFNYKILHLKLIHYQWA